MVHIQGRLVRSGFAHHLGGYARDCGVGLYRLQYHASCAHFGAFTDADIAQNLGASANEHAIADLGMAVAVFLARTAQRYRLQNRHVIAHASCFAHYKARGVVEHDALAQVGRRVNIYAELGAHAVLEKQCQRLPLLVP